MEILRKMSLEVELVPVVEDGVEVVEEYSFAMEYDGPPVDFEIPRALPIDVERIPVASVVSHIMFSDRISLPVAQPLLASDDLSMSFSKELRGVGEESNVSPTSVIDFERVGDGCVGERDESVKDGSVPDLCCSGNSQFSYSGGSEVLDALKSSTELGSSSFSHQLSEELLGAAAGSCAQDFCESFEKSRELSGASNLLRDSVSYEEV